MTGAIAAFGHLPSRGRHNDKSSDAMSLNSCRNNRQERFPWRGVSAQPARTIPERGRKLERRAFHKLAGLAGLELVLGHSSAAVGFRASSQDNASAVSRSPWDRYLLGAATTPGEHSIASRIPVSEGPAV